ncbi:HAMP domain-containing protein [candidate division KSB1 bacterium]|nr:HAMP domain-containing protein [candidate division KSB1 bacterium]
MGGTGGNRKRIRLPHQNGGVMFRKYKWNFVAVVLFASTIGFLIFDIVLFFSIRHYLFRQTFHEMQMKTQLAVELFEQRNLYSATDNFSAMMEFTYQIQEILDSRVTLIDSSGRVIADSDVRPDEVSEMDNHINRPEVKGATRRGWGQSYRRSDTVNLKLFYTAYPIHYRGKMIGFLRLAYYAENFNESMNTIITLIIAANLVGLILLFWVALLSGTVVTFPILRIVRTAKRISAGDLERTFQEHRKDEVGTLARILNQLTDRLKLQITQISGERAKLEHIFTNLDIGIIAIDDEKNIIHINPEIYQILGFHTNNINSDEIRKILETKQLITSIDETLKTGNKKSDELIYPTYFGKKYLRYIVTPFYLVEQSKSGALIQLQNITELKTLEAIRRDFVANASHELKTPLTAIIGYAETLLEGAIDLPNARLKFIRKIREQGQRLEFLVSDLLKLSELEREQPLVMNEISLNTILEEALEELREKAKQKNIEITTELPTDSSVKADAEGIRTVFNNLIDNAIKYTPANGTVSICVKPVHKTRLRIMISDNGIGIDKKYHDRIFQRFYRVDKARSRAMGGTGLGLAIVKHIIEGHGKNIHIKSKPGEGSTFWFDLDVSKMKADM